MSGTIMTSSHFSTSSPPNELHNYKATTLIAAAPEEDKTDIPSYVCVPVNMAITIKT